MHKIIALWLGTALFVCGGDFYYEYGKKVEVTAMPTPKGVSSSNIRYYKTAKGHEVGVGDEIIVKCAEGVACMKTLQSYGFTKISPLSDTLFLVKVSDPSTLFTLAQKLHAEADIAFAHPNFVKKRMRR